MKVILKRDEFNELNKEYEVHHIEQDKYGNKKIYLNKHRWVAPSLIEKYIEGENMKTIKIIDLFNKIANNEEVPNKIKLKNFEEIYTLREDCTGYKWYGEEKTHNDFGETIHKNLEYILKQDIEILDEPKDNSIERLDIEENAMNRNERYIRKEDNKFVNLSVSDYELAKKINEIIDEVNKLKEE